MKAVISDCSISPRRTDLLLVALVAMAVYFAQALAWPVTAGRDFTGYLLYYNQFWDSAPQWHTLMLFRPPLAPLFIGLAYKLGGTLLLECLLALFFTSCIVSVYFVGTLFGRPIALTTALVTAAYPTYGSMFHQLDSDALYGTVFMLWAALISQTVRSPRWRHFVWHGVALFLMVMVRPTAQVFLLLALLPLLLPRLSWRDKLASSLSYVTVALALLVTWAGYNYWRYDDFTVARGNAAVVPMYRAFSLDRIVSIENGPASRQLSEAISRDLLDRPPYSTYKLDADTVLRSGDTRVWSDLAALSDRVWGWDSDHRILRKAALEAIASHPLPYLAGVLFSMRFSLSDIARPDAPKLRSALPNTDSSRAVFVPGNGHIIPHSYMHWLASNPEGKPRGKAPESFPGWRIDRERIEAELPPRDGSGPLAAFFNRGLTNLYPPIYVFLLIGVIGLALARMRYSMFLLLLAGLALLHLLAINAATALGVYYRVPFDPVFILLGIAGFLRGRALGSGAGFR